MKKIYLTALLLTTFNMLCVSQTGIYTSRLGKAAKPFKKEQREIGLIIRPEIGLVLEEPRDANSISVNIGYQFSPFIYLGGGIGYMGSDKGYDFDTGTFGVCFWIPMYAKFRWYWFDGLSSPFLELDAGVRPLFIANNHKYDYLLFPALGCDIRDFDIKVGVPCHHDDVGGLYLAVGYNFLIHKKNKK